MKEEDESKLIGCRRMVASKAGVGALITPLALVTLAVFLTVATVPAASIAQEVEFRGAFCLTNITSQCATVGYVTGCNINFRFSPRNLGANGAQTRLSLFDGFLAGNYTMASGNPNGTTLLPVNGTRFGRGVATFNSQWKFTSQSPPPATLSASSAAVTFKGAITAFDNIVGCDVTFKGSGVNNAIP